MATFASHIRRRSADSLEEDDKGVAMENEHREDEYRWELPAAVLQAWRAALAAKAEEPSGPTQPQAPVSSAA